MLPKKVLDVFLADWDISEICLQAGSLADLHHMPLPPSWVQFWSLRTNLDHHSHFGAHSGSCPCIHVGTHFSACSGAAWTAFQAVRDCELDSLSGIPQASVRHDAWVCLGQCQLQNADAKILTSSLRKIEFTLTCLPVLTVSPVPFAEEHSLENKTCWRECLPTLHPILMWNLQIHATEIL